MNILQLFGFIGLCVSLKLQESVDVTDLFDIDLKGQKSPVRDCFSLGSENDKEKRNKCAQQVVKFERAMRLKLEMYLKQVANSQVVLPKLKEITDGIKTEVQKSSDMLQKNFLVKVQAGQAAVSDLERKYQSQIRELKTNFKTLQYYANSLGPYILGQNTGMLNNISIALTSVLANQTDERKAELLSIKASYDTSKNQIIEDASLFASDFSKSLDVLQGGINAWQADQKGNLTIIADSLKNLNLELKQKQTNFTSQIRNLSSTLYQEAVETLKGIRDDELVRLDDANRQALIAANKTNDDLTAAANESDQQLRNEDQEYADNLRARVVGLQQQVLGAYEGLNNLAQQLSSNITTQQNTIKAMQTRDQTKLDQILGDIATASTLYSDAADQTKTQGLLTTRRILAHLSQMLDEVKAAVAAKSGQYASTNSELLLSQLDSIKQASDEALQTAGGAGKALGADAADTAFLAGLNTQQMFATMGKLLGGISKLSELVKARVGKEADSGKAMLAVVNNVVGGATADLASSVEAVAAANKARNLDLQRSSLGMTTDVKLQGAQVMSDFEKNLESNMNSMDKVYTDVRDAGLKAVADSSNLVSGSEAAVSSLQDATLALDGVVGEATRKTAAAWNGVTSVISSGEQATDAAIQEASAVLKSFVTSQAKARGDRLVQISQAANNTFRNAFNIFAKQVSESNRLADLGFTNILAGGKRVTADLDAYEVSLNSLVGNLQTKNQTSVDLLVSLKNQSEVAWTAWLADQVAAFKTRVNQSDADLEAEFNSRLESVTATADQLLADVRDKLVNVTKDILNTTGDATAATATAKQTLESLVYADTQMQQKANSTITKLKEANTNQGYKFGNLSASVDTTVQKLLNKTIDAAKTISEKNQSVFNEITNASAAVKSQVSNDTAAFGLFVSDFIKQVRTSRDVISRYQKTQSQNRVDVIQNVVSTMNEAKKDLLARVLSGNMNNYDLMQRFAGILNDIADAQAGLSTDATSAADQMNNKVGNLMQTVFDLKGSMLGELGVSFDRLSREAGLQASQAIAAGKTQMASSAGQVNGLGNQVLNLIDGVIQADQVNGVGLSKDQVAVFKLASMVQGLSVESAAQLRDLMAKISNGQMSLQQALDQATQVNGDSLDTIGDVAAAFQGVMSDYLSSSQIFFDDITNNITTYKAAATAMLNAFNATHQAAVAPLAALVGTAKSLVTTYINKTDAAITNAKNNMTANEAILTAATTSVDTSYGDISQQIATAKANITQIQKDEVLYIDSLLKNATNNITTELTNMLTQYFPQDTAKVEPVKAVKYQLPTVTGATVDRVPVEH